MPGFAESFWTPDYAGGMGVLFGKLQQGVAENEQLLTIARMRAEAEDAYGIRLGDITKETDKIKGGFSQEDAMTIKKAYDGIRTEMQEASQIHRKIATSIRNLVVNPFGRWCDAHSTRVQNSHDDLQSRLKEHDKQAALVTKLRTHYFNKCRLVEDIEEENKLAFQDPSSPPDTSSPKVKIPEIKEPQPAEDSEEEEPVQIGDEYWEPEQLKKILSHMLSNIKIGETKVPIIGTYQNTSSGADIVEYLQKNVGASSVSYAERIGQDLVNNGFLRLVGNLGKDFANSTKMSYQWRPKVFQITGIPDKKAPLNRTFSLGSNADVAESPVVGSLSEYLTNFNNMINNQYPNEAPGDRLRREAAEADARYKAAVRKLDVLRCQLEEAMVAHFKFMERCELDRLKAIKTVVLDFAGAISNTIPAMQSNVDKMMLFQETVQPEGDLRYLLENYRTGGYAPKVQIYDNYYNLVDDQTFGIDVEARARADKKRVPIIVTNILTYLDHCYPDLEGDAARQGVWTIEVALSATHNLRNAINNGKPVEYEILQQYQIPIVASVLKLYLLELPDSLVSSHVYDIVKTIYSGAAAESSDEARISVLQNTLSQLRLSNIATLDALMSHFTRLLELTSADEAYTATLAHMLAPAILRPRIETSLTMGEKHAYRLVRDLFAFRKPIFDELKRASSQSRSTASLMNNRPRAISSDESNRRANIEARQKAIIQAASSPRSRATSPGPGPRHRRDRSVGSAETRFPIASPQNPTHGHRSTDTRGTVSTNSRPSSLEVPGESAPLPNIDPVVNQSPVVKSQPLSAITNGSGSGSGEQAPISIPSPVDGLVDEANGIEKRNSLGRSSATRVSANRKSGGLQRQSLHLADRKRDSVGSLRDVEGAESRSVGVSLTDKPMDD